MYRASGCTGPQDVPGLKAPVARCPRIQKLIAFDVIVLDGVAAGALEPHGECSGTIHMLANNSVEK